MSVDDRNVKCKLDKRQEQALMDRIDEGLEQFVAKTERIWAAYWIERTEIIKIIISLASASVALTVTFSNALVGGNASESQASLLLELLFVGSFGVLCYLDLLRDPVPRAGKGVEGARNPQPATA